MADIQSRQQIEMAKIEGDKQLEYMRLIQHLVTHPLAAQIFGGGEQGAPGQAPTLPGAI
jgi:hypothetical protein